MCNGSHWEPSAACLCSHIEKCVVSCVLEASHVSFSLRDALILIHTPNVRSRLQSGLKYTQAHRITCTGYLMHAEVYRENMRK